jgi:hypothetical protein
MPTIPYSKDLYLRQNITPLTVNKSDRFTLGLNIYDDQGNAWDDNYTVHLNQMMSDQDAYSGSGTYQNQYSGTTSGGVATVFIDGNATENPGTYFFEVIVFSGSGATDPRVSFGEFAFVVKADPVGLSRTFDVEFRTTTVDWLRHYIGDEDKKVFTDAELDAILRDRVDYGTQTETIDAFKKHYYSNLSGPVLDLEITNGVAGNVYRVDEHTKHVEFVSGTAPPDNHQIEISFVNVYFFGAVRDTLMHMATNMTKLSLKAKAEGMSHDLTEVRKNLVDQATTIAAVEHWEPR